MFYMTLMQLVFGAVCAGADGDIALPSFSNMPWVVLIACAGLFAHLCLTSALSLAPATVVVPVDLLRLPVIMLVGFSLYAVVSEMENILRHSIQPTKKNLSLLSEYELQRLAMVYGIETKDLTREEICDKIVTYFS